MSVPSPSAPLEVEEFHRFTARAGGRSARIDIAGIAVEFEGLPEALAAQMAVRYGPYLSPITGAGQPLRVEVLSAPFDYFIVPPIYPRSEECRVLTDLRDGLFRSVSYRLAAWFNVAEGRAQIALARGDREPAQRAVENFLRSAVAWLAIERGGFFLHGASIVRGERCFLFYGPSGAGKSTLAAQSTEGEVISDDLTLLLKRPEGLVAAGGPFRGTYTLGGPVLGTFPVAGFYRLHKDERCFVRRGDAGCFADLLGNLPWVVDQLPQHPHLIDRVRSLVAGMPLRYLHFRKDADFWPAVDAGDDAVQSARPRSDRR